MESNNDCGDHWMFSTFLRRVLSICKFKLLFRHFISLYIFIYLFIFLFYLCYLFVLFIYFINIVYYLLFIF